MIKAEVACHATSVSMAVAVTTGEREGDGMVCGDSIGNSAKTRQDRTHGRVVVLRGAFVLGERWLCSRSTNVSLALSSIITCPMYRSEGWIEG